MKPLINCRLQAVCPGPFAACSCAQLHAAQHSPVVILPNHCAASPPPSHRRRSQARTLPGFECFSQEITHIMTALSWSQNNFAQGLMSRSCCSAFLGILERRYQQHLHAPSSTSLVCSARIGGRPPAASWPAVIDWPSLPTRCSRKSASCCVCNLCARVCFQGCVRFGIGTPTAGAVKQELSAMLCGKVCCVAGGGGRVRFKQSATSIWS